MLTQQRKQHLLDVLQRDGRIVAKECANDLGLSEDTIRRDLRELAGDGLLLRVHGGALPSSRAVQDLGARKAISTPEKQSLARAAAKLIQPGKVVFLDGGTTAVQIARFLDRALRATIVTHSPSVAVELVNHAAEVLVIGGRLFKHSMVNVGAAATEAIRRIRADLYFMGVTGIHAEFGLSTGDAEEAMIKRTIAESSAEIVILASPEKLGAASPFVVAPADMMSTMIVLKSTPRAALAPFRSMSVEVIRVASDE